jgi:hypothetical protein
VRGGIITTIFDVGGSEVTKTTTTTKWTRERREKNKNK